MSQPQVPMALFEPVKIGNVQLRSRIVMSALTRSRSVPTNVPNEVNVEYYAQRAAGGAGLIVTEGTLVAQQGAEWQNAPGIWSQEHVDGWKKVTEAVHERGGAIFAQLWHLGRVSHPEAPEQKLAGVPLYAPSAIAARGGKFRFIPGAPGYVTPTAIEDPSTMIALYQQGAVNAKAAGFDGVELHAANGYLVHQFIDSTSNLRTDDWGGSVEKRALFAIETLKALVEVFGAGRVGVKFSPAGGYNDMGMPLDETLETYRYLLAQVDALGLAYICLSRYSAAFDVKFDDKLRGTPHDVLGSYRPYVKQTKLLLNGGLTPVEADTLVATGTIDAAVFGWLWIGHPDLAQRIQHGHPLDANVDFATLYGHGPGSDQRKGYTDYAAFAGEVAA